MEYLLDTHTALWALKEDEKLSAAAKAIIANTSTSLFVSVVSAWEIAIKVSRGKLEFPGGSKAFFRQMKDNGIELLGVNNAYITHLETLPYIHRDPFDRLLVSTANVEGLTILTADSDIQKYDVLWSW